MIQDTTAREGAGKDSMKEQTQATPHRDARQGTTAQEAPQIPLSALLEATALRIDYPQSKAPVLMAIIAREELLSQDPLILMHREEIFVLLAIIVLGETLHPRPVELALI